MSDRHECIDTYPESAYPMKFERETVLLLNETADHGTWFCLEHQDGETYLHKMRNLEVDDGE